MLVGIEVLVFLLVGVLFSYWGPLIGACFLSLLPELVRTIREWMELVPEAWTEGATAAAVYDYLYEFFDFENEKRLIVYGLILIVMMIVRPQGLVTRNTVRGLRFARRRVSGA